ncbi:hypothetical protein DFH08DRAFT_827813 [Mycena albidolilacea]|uniref:Cytochrome P450 n=1 Tax=Mycena albidolilacea TaxID=1033008 RepID=A0AAD6YXA8_9AGAR|nr:hypothetical protein DFH08DRAFT_827813 [Mycena albidolilacea]
MCYFPFPLMLFAVCLVYHASALAVRDTQLSLLMLRSPGRRAVTNGDTVFTLASNGIIENESNVRVFESPSGQLNLQGILDIGLDGLIGFGFGVTTSSIKVALQGAKLDETLGELFLSNVSIRSQTNRTSSVDQDYADVVFASAIPLFPGNNGRCSRTCLVPHMYGKVLLQQAARRALLDIIEHKYGKRPSQYVLQEIPAHSNPPNTDIVNYSHCAKHRGNRCHTITLFSSRGLRLHGAVPPLLEHVVLLGSDFQLMEYTIPPGTAFDPERRLNDDSAASLRSAHLMPFGLGTRTCSGQSLAKAALCIAVAALVQNFTITSHASTTKASMTMGHGFPEPEPETETATWRLGQVQMFSDENLRCLGARPDRPTQSAFSNLRTLHG